MIDDLITSSVANSVYRSIIEELKQKDVLDSIDSELLLGNSSEHEEQHKEYTSIYRIDFPDKNPETLRQIKKSVINYLCCKGKGFKINYEKEIHKTEEIEEYLRTHLELAGLNELDIQFDIEFIDGKEYITVELEDKKYSKKRERHRYDVNDEWLEPLIKAVEDSPKTDKNFYNCESFTLVLTKKRILSSLSPFSSL